VSPVRYKLSFLSQKTAFFIITAVKTSKLTRPHPFAILNDLLFRTQQPNVVAVS
jgi:hypothetical protein